MIVKRILFCGVYPANMIVQIAFPVIFVFLRVLAFTGEMFEFNTELSTSNEFENNTTGENSTGTTTESSNGYVNDSINAFNIINVTPPEIVIDTTTELQLSIGNYTGTNTTPTFCFVTTPDNDLQVLYSHWVSNTHLNCTGFCPAVAGVYAITADLTNFEKNVTFKVLSKHPVAEGAEYGNNYDNIFIRFDGNIQMCSNCESSFAEETTAHFGVGFTCAVNGDVVVVKMGIGYTLTAEVEIKSENEISRSGSGKGFRLAAKPGRVAVAPPKVPGPVLSIQSPTDCSGNISQNHLTLKLTTTDHKPTHQTSPVETPGQNQRKNLIIWRTLRRLQTKFPTNTTLKIDKQDFQTMYENLELVETLLVESETNQPSSRAGVTVTVSVQSPCMGAVLAEADVTFCDYFNKSFRYVWIVNDDVMPGHDKLLMVKGRTAGKYIIKCCIVADDSSELLAQGWAAMEILNSVSKVIVSPVEIVTTLMKDVSLRAVAWHGERISWTCRTNMGKTCVTTSQQLVSDVIHMNSTNVTIPAGSLPPDEYIWMVENAQGVNTARVIVKPENAVTINVELRSVFVSQSEDTILNGTISGVRTGCKVWWSSVRRRGFNYVNLQKVGAEVLTTEGETEEQIDLVLPSETLQANCLYMFRLEAICPGSAFPEYVTLPIRVNLPPKVTPIEVDPRKGLAMTTVFTISQAQAEDEDYPLLFDWSYVDTCGVEVPITKGAVPRSMTTYLPPGDIHVVLKVCDVTNACSKVSSSLVEVTHSKVIPENYHNATNEIYHQIAGGDYLRGFGLATTVIKSLALKPEREIREKVFRSVEEGIYTRLKRYNESSETALDFVERAFGVVRYFPRRSHVRVYLTDFKNRILNGVSLTVFC